MTYSYGNKAEKKLQKELDGALSKKGTMNTNDTVEVRYYDVLELIESHERRRKFMQELKKLRELIVNMGASDNFAGVD